MTKMTVTMNVSQHKNDCHNDCIIKMTVSQYKMTKIGIMTHDCHNDRCSTFRRDEASRMDEGSWFFDKGDCLDLLYAVVVNSVTSFLVTSQVTILITGPVTNVTVCFLPSIGGLKLKWPKLKWPKWLSQWPCHTITWSNCNDHSMTVLCHFEMTVTTTVVFSATTGS